MLVPAILLVPAATLALVMLTGCGPVASDERGAALSLTETLGGGDTLGYARALEPRPFAFPADHGPHPAFRNEWWYFTGNLEGAGPSKRRFGFQFTIFRGALAPPAGGVAGVGSAQPDSAQPGAADAWATRQVYLGHFTVTDLRNERFLAAERYTRGSVGLAGARAHPFRVWLDDWEVAGPERGPGIWPVTLRVRDSVATLELRLSPVKPLVLQGDDGLSRKGPEPGNASFYYSFTRLAARGTIRFHDTNGDNADAMAIPVTGTAWLDREWSTSALSDGVEGWDWFALQLDDGSDLMVYRLRHVDGTLDPFSEGAYVDASGVSTRLAADAFDVEPTGTFTSTIDATTTYPSGWVVRVPERDLELRVTPLLADQELDLSIRYWEGAVDVEGTAAGRPVTGRGYVELTGYAKAPGRDPAG